MRRYFPNLGGPETVTECPGDRGGLSYIFSIEFMEEFPWPQF